ncbi:MAG: hypothetical protein KatS3mg059_0544 [Thermomicrobiales bacterium]|nr:MAG: hypothetical protein KatS3mg059_0544 [Thermomicrobiales bacterium]
MAKRESPQRGTAGAAERGSGGKPSGAYDPNPGPAVRGKGRSGNAVVTESGHVQPRRAERRQELIKRRREELRKLPAKRQRERLLVRIGLASAALLLVGLAVFSVVTWIRDRELNQMPDGVMTFSYQGGQHDDTYNAWPEIPPVGGVHNNIWQNCGFYDKPINSGTAVHSLEHGAVWITYRPDLPADQVEVLKKIAEDNSYVIVSPYEGLPSPVVATFWNHQLRLDSAQDSRLKQFVRFFLGKRLDPSYTPEPGAACSGGTDATV